MTFQQNIEKSVSSSIALVEIDISTVNLQWINCGAGIWKVSFDNLYPEIDSTLLDGFTIQSFTDIGSVQCDNDMLIKVTTLLEVTNNYQSFYFDDANNVLYITIINYDSPYNHTIFLGEIYGFCKKEFVPINANLIYEGRLTKIPPLGISRDPLYFGKISFGSISLDIINSDGQLDTFADSLNIYGNSARILFGYEDMPYEDYNLIYTGFIENIKITEDLVSINLVDKRKQLTKKIYYTCTNKNAIDAIVEVINTAYQNISYNDLFFNITDWEIAKALAPSITIVPEADSTEEVITIIENICKSIFGLFISENDSRYSFKFIDTSILTDTIIPREDILLESLEINYDPTEVISSVKVGYNKNDLLDTIDYYTDTSYEYSVYNKYKTYKEETFDTYLTSLSDAQAFAITIMEYVKDVHGTLFIIVPMKYYSIDFAGVLDCEINRINSTMLGYKKCEILSKQYDLENNFLKLELRIISNSILYEYNYRVTSDGSSRITSNNDERYVKEII